VSVVRRLGQFTIVNGVVSTLIACVLWAVAGLWFLIPPFVVLGAVVVVLGQRLVKRAD
jgi:uncharacterized membrane protein